MTKLFSKLKNLRAYWRRGGSSQVERQEIPVGSSLKDRRILITGGGSGIGLAIAKRCLIEGASVVLVGRNMDRLKRAQKELACERVHLLAWDVGNVSEASGKIIEAETLLGGDIDALVNNAGISSRQSADKLTKEVWDEVLRVNLTGTVFLAKAICDRWISRGRRGALLNISSIAGVGPVVDAYGVSKTALIQLTRGWARQYARHGIRINAIAPGVIVGTELNALQKSVSPNGNVFCSTFPAERFGVPDEIAETALFLLSDRSAYICGQTIVCDGGATLT